MVALNIFAKRVCNAPAILDVQSTVYIQFSNSLQFLRTMPSDLTLYESTVVLKYPAFPFCSSVCLPAFEISGKKTNEKLKKKCVQCLRPLCGRGCACRHAG